MSTARDRELLVAFVEWAGGYYGDGEHVTEKDIDAFLASREPAPPGNAEIDDARKWLTESEEACEEPECHVCKQIAVLLRALDALAREPGLEAEIKDRKECAVKALDHVAKTDDKIMAAQDNVIAALSGKLARVREAAGEAKRLYYDENSANILRSLLAHLDAALADERAEREWLEGEQHCTVCLGRGDIDLGKGTGLSTPCPTCHGTGRRA